METNKYLDALKEHSFKLSNEEVTKKVENIFGKKLEENNTTAVKKLMYSCIDLTTLNNTDTRESVWQFVQNVNDFEGSYSDVNNVAAICVYPIFAKTVKEALTADVKIACVAAGFPHSQTFIETKIAETALAVADGADEIDIVLNLGLFLNEDYEELCEEIYEIKEACHEAHLKVILETGALKDVKKINDAAILSMYSGADFIKTSTGKVYEGATPEAAYAMCSAIKSYYGKNGKRVGFKVSGGVSTVEDSLKYYTIVKEVLGEEWCKPEYFRIGASRLANNLLEEIK